MNRHLVQCVNHDDRDTQESVKREELLKEKRLLRVILCCLLSWVEEEWRLSRSLPVILMRRAHCVRDKCILDNGTRGYLLLQVLTNLTALFTLASVKMCVLVRLPVPVYLQIYKYIFLFAFVFVCSCRNRYSPLPLKSGEQTFIVSLHVEKDRNVSLSPSLPSTSFSSFTLFSTLKVSSRTFFVSLSPCGQSLPSPVVMNFTRLG